MEKLLFEYNKWLQEPRYWKLVNSQTGAVLGPFKGLKGAVVPAGSYDLVWKQEKKHVPELKVLSGLEVKCGRHSLCSANNLFYTLAYQVG